MTNLIKNEQQVSDELFDTFLSFFEHTMELIEHLNEKNGYLKFAAVNMQISLELFMKYYFSRKDKLDSIAEYKNGHFQYKSFEQILNYFFKIKRWSYQSKKELKKINVARNYIVHKGLNAGWNSELALYIIKCAFFIQGTLASDFNINLFEPSYNKPNNLRCKNQIWRAGVEQFVIDITSNINSILPCPECGAKALISNEEYDIGLVGATDALICLCCFNHIGLEIEARLIDCYVCGKNSYLIDPLNEQPNNTYVAKCLNCETDSWVKKCSYCDKFFHESKQVLHTGSKSYCSLSCYETDN